MDEDRSIDYSDISETDENFWKNAKIQLYDSKPFLTIRLDPDIIEWFREEGAGYQTRINAVLRSYIEAHPHHN